MKVYVDTVFGPEEVDGKRCIKCGEIKPLSEFKCRTYSKDGKPKEHRNDCIKCWKRESKIRTELRKKHINSRPDDDTPCRGCLITPNERREKGQFLGKSVWVLEHDHKTGEFRGWCCDYCNTILARSGLHGDDPDTLRRLADILEGLQ